MLRIIILKVIALCSLTSCSHQPVIEQWGEPTSKLAFKFIPDETPLNNKLSPTLEQLALTLPIFEGPPSKVSEGQGTRYENQGKTWVLGYDGAQKPVVVDLLSYKGQPSKIRLSIGPEQPLGNELWEYILERREGGWKRISARTILKNKIE
jgi:hypothetical protein